MAREEDVADLLEQAADRLDVYGWGQDNYRSTDGSYCAMGAIRSAFETSADQGLARALLARVDAVDRVALALEESGKVPLGEPMSPASVIICWNDVPGRTQGEVTDLLRKVAKDIRNDQGQ